MAQAWTAPDDVNRSFNTLTKSQVDLVFIPSDPMLFAEGRKIATAALTARVPTIFSIREDVDGGGLMSYGVDYRDNFRRAADYVDKILRGARPTDLPVELPTKFELSQRRLASTFHRRYSPAPTRSSSSGAASLSRQRSTSVAFRQPITPQSRKRGHTGS
jgi:hypothetical protein